MPRIVYSLLWGSWSLSPVYLCCIHRACVMCVCACTCGGGSTRSLCPWGHVLKTMQRGRGYDPRRAGGLRSEGAELGGGRGEAGEEGMG